MGVGIASTTDPVTGRKLHSVYGEADAGVAVGGPHPYPPPPGSSTVDRTILENQLTDRSLPEGDFLVPVVGYLYFPANYVKKHSGNIREVGYTTADGSRSSHGCAGFQVGIDALSFVSRAADGLPSSRHVPAPSSWQIAIRSTHR